MIKKECPEHVHCVMFLSFFLQKVKSYVMQCERENVTNIIIRKKLIQS